ncbi:cytochrome c3 family protein [Roseiconus lacunae]|uniref:cytochrome c3 family protein n=1 Tax=Roseiconus lacunae TaxID=2605694 RepID=UPI0011F3BE68|nr:cytochrome c3 family protein [Roseiconus lacunae]
MRENELPVTPPPTDDRPNDRWLVDDGGSQSLTWFGQRRRWYWGGSIGSIALCLSAFFFVPPATLIKPGKLSGPHAQILSGSVGNERCAACHDRASLDFSSWFGRDVPGHQGVQQSDRCLTCHHRTIDANLARSAHNLPRSVRTELSEIVRTAMGDHSGTTPRTQIDQEDLECSVCHQEHHGLEGDLLAVSDQQCQACHTIQFGQFADSHPDWSQWPYGRGGSISFNHATHQGKHFPGWQSGAVAFDCNRCHPDQEAVAGLRANRHGELLRTVSFESGCATCHEQSMKVASADGIELLAVPSVSKETAIAIGDWPQSATGFIDGRISPMMELLLRGDPKVADALRQIPGGDLARLDPMSLQSESLSRIIAEATARLINDISKLGHRTLRKRLSVSGITTSAPMDALLRTLPAQFVQAAQERWFDTKQELGVQAIESPQASSVFRRKRIRLVAADGDDLLGTSPIIGDPLSDDSLLGDSLLDHSLSGSDDDPLGASAFDRASISDMNESNYSNDLSADGGWYRDDLTLSIRYRPTMHADLVLKELVELFSGLSDSDPVKTRMLSLPAVEACVRCHPGATHLPASWEATPTVGGKRDFTKFSHRPHLNVSALGQCTHCHQVATLPTDPSVTASGGGLATFPDFAPLGQQTCAACHRKNAASDRCTTCHHYHIEH